MAHAACLAGRPPETSEHSICSKVPSSRSECTAGASHRHLACRLLECAQAKVSAAHLEGSTDSQASLNAALTLGATLWERLLEGLLPEAFSLE